jgi:hypothetical protein
MAEYIANNNTVLQHTNIDNNRARNRPRTEAQTHTHTRPEGAPTPPKPTTGDTDPPERGR